MKETEIASIRSVLKNSTQPEHTAAEELMEARGCFRGAPGFLLYLEAMANCHRRFRAAELLVAPECGLAPRADELLAAIDIDRERIGATRGAPAEARAGDEAEADEAWGVVYALEGSSMGARMLKPLSAGFFPDGQPSRYLTLLADEGPARWRSFVQSLERASPDAAAAVSGARRVFATVAERLEAAGA